MTPRPVLGAGACLPAVAIVGYTNAGKSTLLNSLVGKEVVGVEDKLFATLDPTSRRVSLGEGQSVMVTDTVGFIHKLPHQLVDAFRATLDEVVRADVLIEVVDAADPHMTEHRRTIQVVLDELGAGHKPRVVAFNKVDLVEEATGRTFSPPKGERNAVGVSALRGSGVGSAALGGGGRACRDVELRWIWPCRTPPGHSWRASASGAPWISSTRTPR